jgi:hypothetical protein
LFWAKQFPEVAMTSQMMNVDKEMSNILGVNSYQRWQFNMEDPIRLDDHSMMNELSEMAKQYIEEIKESDTNDFNKLIEKLLTDAE